MNLHTMFRTAEGYLLAGKFLLDSMPRDSVNFLKYYISPCVSNLAFACEIYLKYLYVTENNNEKSIKTHELLGIYDKLYVDTRTVIRAKYKEYKSILCFDDCIKKHNKTFEEFRYMYEQSDISVEPYSLYNFTVALREICIIKQEDPDTN